MNAKASRGSNPAPVHSFRIYAAATRPKDSAGKYGFWGLVAFLLVLYAASIVSPPPSSVSALAWGALIGWPLTLWPWWVDRHRQSDVRPT